MRFLKTWDFNCLIPTIPEIIHFQRAQVKSASRLSEHTHENAFEFVYIEKGKATWRVGDELVETVAGDVFHTNPDEPHSGRYNIIEPCKLWAVIVRLPTIAYPLPRWLQLTESETTAIIDSLRLLPRVVHPGIDALGSLMKIAEVIGHDDILLNLRARLALVEFLLLLLQNQENASVSPHPFPTILQQIVEELNAYASWNPTIKELADRMGISEAYFHRLFKQYTRLTPKTYMERRRIHAACALLNNRSLTITDIALELGFANSQHFATVFRRHMGRTPSMWRAGNTNSLVPEE